jgi:plastocyanin
MAAIDFPSNPTNNQEFVVGNTVYTYVSAKNLWKAVISDTGSGGGTGGSSTFAGLTDTLISSPSSGALLYYNGAAWTNTGKTYDQIYKNASRTYAVTTSGNAYVFDGGDTNQNISVTAGDTVAFHLDCNGHPFQLQQNGQNITGDYIVHVSPTGTVSTGADAQGKVDGTLYATPPDNNSETWTYQCSIHGTMQGNILVKGRNTEPVSAISPASNILSVDCSLSSTFAVTLDSAVTTVQITNVPTSGTTLTFLISNSASYGITWPPSFNWANGSAPSLTQSGTDIISAITTDGGTTWFAFVAGQAFS